MILIIPIEYTDKCLICGEIAPDNYRHWVIRSSAMNTHREEYLNNLISMLKAVEKETKWQDQLLSYMLRGGLKSKIPKDMLEKERNKADMFNEKLALHRKIKIREAKSGTSVIKNDTAAEGEVVRLEPP